MNTKLMTALGCMLMFAALPMGTAHTEGSQHLGLTATETATTFGTPPAAATAGNPAGWYYGSASLWAATEGNALPTGFDPFTMGEENNCDELGVSPPDTDALVELCKDIVNGIETPDISLNLGGGIIAAGYCDFEIIGAGDTDYTGSDPNLVDFYIEDEDTIDGVSVPANDPYGNARVGPGGTGFLTEQGIDTTGVADVDPVIDGDFNDGGVASACHSDKDVAASANGPVQAGHYDQDDFNTAGCGSGNAYARDLVFGGVIWIGTSCSYLVNLDAPGALTMFEDCVVGEVLTPTDPWPGVGPVGPLSTCATDFLGCLQPGGICNTPVGTGTECGQDSFADDGNAERGSTGVPYPAVGTEDVDGDGVVDSDDISCGAYASAGTFAWNAANIVTNGANNVVVDSTVAVATHGWIA